MCLELLARYWELAVPRILSGAISIEEEGTKG